MLEAAATQLHPSATPHLKMCPFIHLGSAGTDNQPVVVSMETLLEGHFTWDGINIRIDVACLGSCVGGCQTIEPESTIAEVHNMSLLLCR